MDVGSISTAISLVKDVANQVTMLKNLTSDIETATEIQEAKQKAIDLTNTIISLQTAIMSMQADYMALAEENARLKQEKEKKEQYQLVEYPTEMTTPIMLYKFIGKGITHYICPNCYDRDGKSITLQHKTQLVDAIDGISRHKDMFVCNACATKYTIRFFFKDKHGEIHK